MKTWFNGQLKEGDRVICIEEPRATCVDGIIKKDTQYRIFDGCLGLWSISELEKDLDEEIVYIGLGCVMPTAEWFFNHFALLT